MTSEWKTCSVQELIDAGMLEEPMDGNHGGIHPKTSDYVSSGVPFIMANNLINGKVDYKNCAFISERQAATLRKGFSHPGDVYLHIKQQSGEQLLSVMNMKLLSLRHKLLTTVLRKVFQTAI